VADSSSIQLGDILGPTGDTKPIIFRTDGPERARINSSGKLLSPNGAAFFGTVSNSGNGAIMEHGSNANGEFVRYADGTQICLGVQTMTSASNTAVGSGFRSDTVTFTFPASFSGDPGRTVASVDAAGSWAVVATSSTTTFGIRTFNFTSAGTPFDIRFVSVGRWY